MAQTRLKSGNLHMVGGDNGTSGQVLKSRADGTFEWGEAINPPTFSSVDYPGSATALDPAGDESLVINGSNFTAGITLTIGGTTPSSITLNSSTQLTVTTPAKTAGTYDIVFTNTNGGTATATNAVSYNGIPAFTNAAGSLGSVVEGDAVNLSAAATEPDGGAITYAITSGSLPSGLSLNTSTGAITGTAPSVSANTTSNFTVTATDNENQTSSRAYSITVTKVLPSGSFNTVLYTGNGSTQSITGVGFQPDFVWVKRRSSAEDNAIFDSSRGVQKQITANKTNAESTKTNAISSFDSDGFTTGANNALNTNTETYVAWCFKANGGTTSSNTDGTITSTVQANNTLGFSIVKYTGNNTANATIGHGLSSTPQLIISKNLDNGSAYWATYHHSIGITRKFYLNNTSIGDTVSGGWLDVSSTLITLKQTNANNINENGSDFINYCFTEVEDFSKFGSYIGNGSADGPIVTTGFEPAFLMVKRTDSADGWIILDNKRDLTNPRNNSLKADENLAEEVNSTNRTTDFFSNGFQIKHTHQGMNASGGTYLYMAFAADPDTTSPTLADSFNAITWTGNGSSNRSFTGLGFQPNLVWAKSRSNAFNYTIYDSVRGPERFISSDSTGVERVQDASGYLTSFDSDGFSTTGGSPYGNEFFNYNGSNFVAWAWKVDDNEPTIFFEDTYVAAYKFDETNAGETADDLSGNFDLANDNVSYTTTAKFTRAADFNGTNAKLKNDSFSPLVGSFAYSVSFWFYADSLSGDQWLFGLGNSTNFTDTSIYLRNNNTIFHDNTGNSDYIANNTVSLSTSTWYHFVFVYDGAGTGTGYLNGSKLSDFSRTLNRTGTTLRIGCRQNDTYFFDGKIDQMRFYTQALDQTQVNSLYNETTSNNSTLEFPSGITSAKVSSIVSANANAGFSIVKYEGDGTSGRRIPHGLSSAPELIIAKANTTSSWVVYTATTGTNKILELNTTAAEQTISNYWGTSSPSATTFGVAPSNSNNNSTGNDIIAYCFHSVSGFSKIGSYTGTSSSGNSVNVGFAPDWVLIKGVSAGSSWILHDTVRSDGTAHLRPNTSGAEDTGSNEQINFTSTGFSIRNSGATQINTSGDTYIYMAFKIN